MSFVVVIKFFLFIRVHSSDHRQMETWYKNSQWSRPRWYEIFDHNNLIRWSLFTPSSLGLPEFLSFCLISRSTFIDYPFSELLFTLWWLQIFKNLSGQCFFIETFYQIVNLKESQSLHINSSNQQESEKTETLNIEKLWNICLMWIIWLESSKDDDAWLKFSSFPFPLSFIRSGPCVGYGKCSARSSSNVFYEMLIFI